ncbi:MAG: hypothetical protein KDA91_20950 [Planctomycetaceae bacterium]|nr:hypothetical protein [Planctomycetaceae bacterium]
MTQTNAPTVVFIDDHEEELKPLAELVSNAGMAGCKVDSPEDVDAELLEHADLVIVDYTLDDWIGNVDVNQLSLKPVNGVALASVLREHYRTEPLRHAPPTGFALITGKPDAISTSPGERRPHVVARLSNLEWFFEKYTDSQQNADQIVSLAIAIHSLPSGFSENMVELDELIELLGVTHENPLFERYRDAVGLCRPPLHHLSKESGGLILIRWLLHRILPHTSFLIDERNLAARLRVTIDSLRLQLAENGQFMEELANYAYTGLLSTFDGIRWWRGGIEQWLWNITDGQSSKPAAVLESLKQVGADKLVPTEEVRPVVTLNEHLKQEDSLTSRSDVVAIQLDDWPSYAEPAYVRREILEKHDFLKLFVTEV